MRRGLKRKKRRVASVPVASMGDIAFLLIIFFILLSDFNKDKTLDMVLPFSKKVEKVDDRIVARVDIDRNGVIYLDGIQVRDDKDVLARVETLLEKTISDDQRHVQFKCDASQSRDVYAPVLQAIAEAGGIIEAVGTNE